MDLTLFPGKLHGTIYAVPSKSQAHRFLICAAFADKPTTILCKQTNKDIEATVACLNALGATITRNETGYYVIPVANARDCAVLPCCESGSTLRFLLPVVGALGVTATFKLEGRLPQRPLSPLWEEMESNGCRLSRPTPDTIQCSGRLNAGRYQINGSVSSQFISGLLFAMNLINGVCALTISGKVESRPYIDMTLHALQIFGVHWDQSYVSHSQRLISPGTLSVEGDWSNGAFFLAARYLGNDTQVKGLNRHSAQGDRAIWDILKIIDTSPVIDVADIPDLMPILAITAASKSGATFTNISRLRLKESDRVAAVTEMLNHLGASTTTSQNTLQVHPSAFHSCIIDAHGDHRIAMSAAIAATVTDGPITVLGADCVSKSYPSFWGEYKKLGGTYEQYIR